MSAQKNTLFNYFGKSPAAKSSPSAGSAPATPKTSRVTDSPSGTPKRALGNGARAAAHDSPKSTKSVLREHLVAASPRTRVQRKLLDAAALTPTYEPHFLRNISSPQNKKSGQYASPQKNKENAKRGMMSPVFKALKEHEDSVIRNNLSPNEKSSQPSREDVVISPAKCSPRKPVRNLNKEFASSPVKRVGEETLHGKKVKSTHEDSDGSSENAVDIHSVFGQYVASEMRRLDSDRAVRSLKLKIMKAILEVQKEQEEEAF